MTHMRATIALIFAVLIGGCQTDQITQTPSADSYGSVPPEKAILCNYHDAFSMNYPQECIAGGGVIEK